MFGNLIFIIVGAPLLIFSILHNDIVGAIAGIILLSFALFMQTLFTIINWYSGFSENDKDNFVIIDSLTNNVLQQCTGRKAVLKAQRKWHKMWVWYGGPQTYIKRVVNKENGK